MRTYRMLYRTLSKLRRRQLVVTLWLMLCAAAAELTTVAMALSFIGLLTGAGTSANSGFAGAVRSLLAIPNVTTAAMLLIAALVMASGTRILLTYRTQQLITGVAHDLATSIFDGALRQSYASHTMRNSSAILGGMEKVNAVTFGILQSGIQGLVAGVIALSIAALLFAIHPWATAAAAAALAIMYLAVGRFSDRTLQKNSTALAAAATARARILNEALGSIRDILIGGSQEFFSDRYKKADARLRQAAATNALLAQSPRYLIEGGTMIAFVAIALLMSRQTGSKAEIMPILGAMAIGAHRLLPLVQQVYLAWSSSSGNLTALIDIIPLVQVPPTSAAFKENKITFHNSLELCGVSFSYDNRASVLRELNLSIPAGGRIGITGATGEGKSTLVDLVMGLLEPSAGQIRIDGTILDGRSRRSWQAQLTHVPQSIYLLDESIAANIAFGIRPDVIDYSRAYRCAEAACLLDVISELPQGMETHVGERGVRLSGGQRQRIAIARALYSGAPVLVLDEATSALDEVTEAAVLQSVTTFCREMTLIVIAHRQTALRQCDSIIVVEGGRAVHQIWNPPATRCFLGA